jgi:hypothetical protein
MSLGLLLELLVILALEVLFEVSHLSSFGLVLPCVIVLNGFPFVHNPTFKCQRNNSLTGALGVFDLVLHLVVFLLSVSCSFELIVLNTGVKR